MLALYYASLRQRKTTMGREAENLTGQVFGRLTVTVKSQDPRFRTPAWVCQCSCGTVVGVRAMSLKSGATRSCGCLNTERRAELKTKHGYSGHSSYKTWKAMISRCHNPTDKDFPEYGARGISVCARWHELAEFIQDMGEKPEGHSLERIDNSKGYGPENCRWATPAEQGANKRNNNVLIIGGVQIHLAGAARMFGLTETTIRRRLESGMTAEQAVNTPVRKRSKKAAP